ncbi:MAG: hypothetical protein KIT84_42270 [Labilithrix sp.]|nr:hypothetical protein [Labilithrix sp.]MCW5817702.1 hypothetical protein [Labilithrix sp.]
MSTPKAALATQGDPVLAALDNAKPLDVPLSPEEADALEEAMEATAGPPITTKELLERLRPKS